MNPNPTPNWCWRIHARDSKKRNIMKRKLLTLFMVVGSVYSFGQTAGKAEQGVLDLSKRKFDWLISNQYDSLIALLDDKAQYIHSNGWIQTKNEVIEDSKSGKLKYQSVSIKDAQARIYGTSAVVTGLGTFAGIKEGNSFSMDLRYTEVYVRSGNRWKLVSRHANRMP
jgi:hypothetical protein